MELKKAEKIVQWFKNLQVIFPETTVQALPIRMKAMKICAIILQRMLDKMDTGVYEISVASDEIDFHEFAQKLDLPKEIVDDIEEIKNGS